MSRLIAAVLLIAIISACAAIPAPAERRRHADGLAATRDWQAIPLVVSGFSLLAYVPAKIEPSAVLTVYIEGDGFAWVTGSRPSADPTPRDPLALRLALAHPDRNAAYLARPCQFANAELTGCAERYWTDERFAPEVIAATDQALDVLKTRSGAKRLNLVGYSGGGAVGMLVAARRQDIDRLVTVGGNLDHVAWTTHHRVQPLIGSLNPVAVAVKLNGVRQWHFAGGRDRVVPPWLIEEFASRFAAAQRPHIHTERDFDHLCCWAENWGALWGKVVAKDGLREGSQP
jgi:hypothetical protein